MKNEVWNGYSIRFVIKDGEQKMVLNDFLAIVEELTEGKYLDIAETYGNHDVKLLPMSSVYKLDDGRLLVKTLWEEIDNIAVTRPFPVFVDITKAYGIADNDELISVLYPKKETEIFDVEDMQGTQGTYIIMAESVLAYKIGASGNVENRFKQLEFMSPVKLCLYGIIETSDYYAIESELHQIFAHKRLHGEWFSLSNQDLEIIKTKYRLKKKSNQIA